VSLYKVGFFANLFLFEKKHYLCQKFNLIIMDNNNNNKNQLNIELTDEIAEGIYSNLAVIAHSSTEFIIDFIKLMPASPKAKVKSRIILTPQNAKRLYKALADNISKYESTHGTIKDVNEKMPPFTMGGPAAQA